jgi:hypothetical protein
MRRLRLKFGVTMVHPCHGISGFLDSDPCAACHAGPRLKSSTSQRSRLRCIVMIPPTRFLASRSISVTTPRWSSSILHTAPTSIRLTAYARRYHDRGWRLTSSRQTRLGSRHAHAGLCGPAGDSSPQPRGPRRFGAAAQRFSQSAETSQKPPQTSQRLPQSRVLAQQIWLRARLQSALECLA